MQWGVKFRFLYSVPAVDSGIIHSQAFWCSDWMVGVQRLRKVDLVHDAPEIQRVACCEETVDKLPYVTPQIKGQISGRGTQR